MAVYPASNIEKTTCGIRRAEMYDDDSVEREFYWIIDAPESMLFKCMSCPAQSSCIDADDYVLFAYPRTLEEVMAEETTD